MSTPEPRMSTPHHALHSKAGPHWGQPPWMVELQGDFKCEDWPLPKEVDFAVVGAGFSGLAAAAWLRYLEPKRTVAVFEADCIGAGSSGHTGGMALGETAAGDLPGLGNVLAGLGRILDELGVRCDLMLPGAFEIGHTGGMKDSPISWQDSGELRVTGEVPGGTVDPGKMLTGLARAAYDRGAMIFENATVQEIDNDEPPALYVRGRVVRARCVLLATNAESLELSRLAERAEPKFTLALATEPLTQQQMDALGLGPGKPFYTVDLPYLWGRVLYGNRVIFGSGLVHLRDWRELLTLDISSGEAAVLLRNLEHRVRQLHPVLREVRLSHRWGGPILIADKWQPVFMRHPANKNAIVLGAFSGHGVAQSVYLGAWAAEVMLGKKDLPQWDPEENPAE
jgi:glycine/D-amino acid oxidase-like deaminating enzyme